MRRRAVRAGLGLAGPRLVPRGAILLGGTAGTVGAWLTGHGVIAVSALLVMVVASAVIAVGELWAAKRRDDLFRLVVTQRKADPEVLRALTLHEAVRSRLLASEDARRLLRSAPGAPRDAGAGGGRGRATGTSSAADRGRRPGPRDGAQSRELSGCLRPVDSGSRSAGGDGDCRAGDSLESPSA